MTSTRDKAASPPTVTATSTWRLENGDLPLEVTLRWDPADPVAVALDMPATGKRWIVSRATMFRGLDRRQDAARSGSGPDGFDVGVWTTCSEDNPHGPPDLLAVRLTSPDGEAYLVGWLDVAAGFLADTADVIPPCPGDLGAPQTLCSAGTGRQCPECEALSGQFGDPLTIADRARKRRWAGW